MIFRREPLSVTASSIHDGWLSQHSHETCLGFNMYSGEDPLSVTAVCTHSCMVFTFLIMHQPFSIYINAGTQYRLQLVGHIRVWCSPYRSNRCCLQHKTCGSPPIGYRAFSTFGSKKHDFQKKKKCEAPLSVTGLPTHSEKYILVLKIDFEENPLSVTALCTPFGIVWKSTESQKYKWVSVCGKGLAP